MFRVALNIFISLAGDRDVGEYSGEDAKLLVRHLALRGNKTATIRRINSLSVILNYAYAELDLAKSNPFTRLIIRNEENDFSKRGTFNCSTMTNSDRPTMTKRAILQGLATRLKARRVAETVIGSCLAQYGWKK